MNSKAEATALTRPGGHPDSATAQFHDLPAKSQAYAGPFMFFLIVKALENKKNFMQVSSFKPQAPNWGNTSIINVSNNQGKHLTLLPLDSLYLLTFPLQFYP